jgi:hypothetical protein
MNDMFKFLEETHDQLRNRQDVQTIESMIEVTKDTMSQHIDAYNMFKGQIEGISTEAQHAITKLNFYEAEKETTQGIFAGTLGKLHTQKQLQRV